MTGSQLVVGDDGSPAAAAARAWAERLASATGGDIAVMRVDAGPDRSVAAGLLARARDHGADLVVVGRRGGGGFPSLQLGSTAHQLAEHASTPVAVVPLLDAGQDPSGPVVSRLAVGVDGSPAAAAATSWATSLAVGVSAALWLVHALDFGPAFAGAGLGDTAYARAVQVASERVEREWAAPLRRAGVAYETVITEGGPTTVLLDTARADGIDLLVVGRRGVGDASAVAMGGVAHCAIAFAPCPAVVVPAAD